MLRVGLTGGLGSGKSSVAGFFRDLGAHVLEADAVARDLMQPGQPVYDAIVGHFGSQVVRPGRALDRARLATLAFAEGRVEELNRIVHPPVIAVGLRWMEEIGAADPDAIAIYESAILFETDRGTVAPGWRRSFDAIVLVTAPEPIRIARFLERSERAQRDRTGGEPLSAAARKSLIADARSRLRRQIPEAEKIALSDYILPNDASLEEARQRTAAIYTDLQNRAHSTSSRFHHHPGAPF
ncbi:MAG: dephospho-CoA kinase [Acidobacteriaceae bacterium]